jgi:hypothetical protein
MLTRIWSLPDDLPHAAGSLAHAHYPGSDPQFPRADLHWGPPTMQQVLDIALARAMLNHHFEIASFLLARGADINTDWATHEPASILR